MADDEDSVVAKMKATLAKSGYPLEMRVGRAARAQRPTYVHQSRYYVDPTTKKVRETDVLVCWQVSFKDPDGGARTWTALYLVIECKSNPEPWVVFDEGQEPTHDAGLRLDLAVVREEPATNYLHRMMAGQSMTDTLFAPSRIGVGITAPTSNKDIDPAWSAVQAAVAAAHGFMGDVPSPAEVSTSVNIVVQPVVVTSGVLLRSYLDSDGNLQVERVDVAEVTVRQGEDPSLTRCLVVTESYVEALMASAEATIHRFGYP